MLARFALVGLTLVASLVPIGPASDLLAELRAILTEVRAAQAARDEAGVKDALGVALDLLEEAEFAPGDEEAVEPLLELIALAAGAGEQTRAGRLLRRTAQWLDGATAEQEARLARGRMQLAELLDARGQLAPAKEQYERALPALEAEVPTDARTLGRTRTGLARILMRQGELERARELQEGAVEALQSAQPRNDFELAQVRGVLGEILISLGEDPAAREHLEAALAVFEATLPAEHPNVAALGLNLAIALDNLGQLDEARARLEALVRMHERTLHADHPSLAAARHNLSNTLSRLGEVDAALELAERVLDVRERTFPVGHPDRISIRGNVSALLAQQGELEAAREMLDVALVELERALPADHPVRLTAQMNLAGLLMRTGELSAARALLETVVAARERLLPPEHLDRLDARANLALVLCWLGDRAAARAIQEDVLARLETAFPEGHPALSAARTNLADTLRVLGEVPAARALCERILASRESTLAPDHPETIEARLALARVLLEIGDVQAALEQQRGQIELLERAFPAEHPALAPARLHWGTTLFLAGEWSSARDELARVLAAWEGRVPDEDPFLAGARINLCATLGGLLAASAEGSAEWERARAELHALGLRTAQAEAQRARAVWLEGSPREVEERMAAVQRRLSGLLAAARAFGLAPPSAELVRAVFLLSETTRAGGLVSARLAARCGADPVARDLRRDIARESAVLADLARSGGSTEALDRTRVSLDEAGRALAARARELMGDEAMLEPTLEGLARALAPAQALVAFRRVTDSRPDREALPLWINEERLIAFVLRPSNAPQAEPSLELVDLGALAHVEIAAEAWRAALGSASDARGVSALGATEPADDPMQAGELLRARVLDPLHAALRGAVHVVLVPDDVLHAVPLDALPAGVTWSASEPEALLGERLRIELRSSALELLLERGARAGERRFVAIGDPDFGAPSEAASDARAARPSSFQRLPATRAEVTGVAALFASAYPDEPAPEPLMERAASSEQLAQRAPGANWLHVATHGWFAPDWVRSSADAESIARGTPVSVPADSAQRIRAMSPMLLCGLALSGANEPADVRGGVAGLVTAQELAALDLSACELAVLSACETGLGLRRAGQGVASLQRALHLAGARTVVTSLWKVPDEATKELMLAFYRGMWIEGRPKHAALWEAKRALRDARDEHGAALYAPRDWAGWVLTGEPD